MNCLGQGKWKEETQGSFGKHYSFGNKRGKPSWSLGERSKATAVSEHCAWDQIEGNIYTLNTMRPIGAFAPQTTISACLLTSTWRELTVPGTVGHSAIAVEWISESINKKWWWWAETMAVLFEVACPKRIKIWAQISSTHGKSWAWQYAPIIVDLGRQRQKDWV